MDFETLGSQIQKRRKELGLRQIDLADKAKVSRIYISQIERGVASNISTNILDKLATALETTSADLTGQSTWKTLAVTPGNVTPGNVISFLLEACRSKPEVVDWIEIMLERWKKVASPREDGATKPHSVSSEVMATETDGTIYFISWLAQNNNMGKAENRITEILKKGGLEIL